MRYLKQFIIGSSSIVFLPFFYLAQNIKLKTYNYYEYTLIAPLWFGIWNVISIIISEYLGLSTRIRFILISLITYLCATGYATYNNVYDFTDNQWYKYYLSMLIIYYTVWNIVIYNIEKIIS